MSRIFILPFLFTSLFLCSCGSFVFSSNVDPRNFKEHFRSSLVEEYSNEDMVSFPSYEILGLVEGVDCQVNELYPVPKEGTARRHMLEKASDIGATGVTSVKCVRVESTEACIAEYTCYAQAVKVNDQK